MLVETDTSLHLIRLYEAMPAMLQAVDSDGMLVAASDLWLARLGYTREEAIGRPAASFLAPDSEAYAREVARPLLFSFGRCSNIPLQYVAKDGEIIDMQMSAILADEAFAGPRTRLAVIEDVTPGLRAERELAQERLRLSKLIAATGVGTIEWHTETGAARVNDRWRQMFGWIQAELPAISLRSRADWIHPDDLGHATDALGQLLSGEVEHYAYECRLRRGDGQYIWAQVQGGVLTRSTAGTAEWIFSTITDISERKQQQQALRRSEDFLARTNSVAGVGGWEVDVATGAVAWTQETYRIIGLPLSYQPTLETAIECYAPEARPRLRALVEAALAGGPAWDVELPLIRADGRRITVRAVGSAETVDGRPVRLMGALQDITARVAEREELRAAQERLALATATGTIGVWDRDLRSGVQVWDASMYRLYGLPSGDGVDTYMLWQRALHPEDRASIGEAVREALDGGRPYDAEFRIIWPDGSIRHLRATGQVVRDAAGQALRLLGVNWDVTEHRRLEAAVEAERRRLATIIEATEFGTWEWNVQTGELRVNDRWAAILGHTLEELRPISIRTRLERVHPDDRELSLRLLDQHFAGLTPMYQFDCRMRHRDGHDIWVLSRGKVVTRTADGKPEWMFGTMKDNHQRKQQEEALRRSEGFLLRTGKLAGVGGWEIDLPTGKVSWSAETSAVYGVPPDWTPTLEAGLDFYAPEARPVVRDAVARAIAGGGGWDLELPFIRGDGRRIWMRTIGRAVFADGRAVQLVGACQDITEARRLSAQLAEQHELLRVTLDSIGDGVITTDAQGRVTWLNPVAARLTGWSAARASGKPIWDVFHIVHEETRAPAENPLKQCLAKGMVVGLAGQTLLISRDGQEYGIEDSAAPIHSRTGDLLGMVLVFHDVTEQRRLSGEMTYRASHDALTGLVNRSEFDLRLQRLLHRAQADQTHHAMLYIDLDQFKIVNDTCGHAAGDQLLRQVARLMAEVVRGSDTLARLGGDEFAIILEHCRLENAERLGQRICDQLEVFRFIHDERRFRIGASIGLVPVDARWAGTSAIMQAADSCCYAAKEEGRNRVHVWSDSNQAMHARQGQTQWVTRLEHALEEDRFVLFAQRIAALGEAEHGMHAEVLLRMREGDGALVPPGAFLPAAERFHLASRIDRWVLRGVIRWMRTNPSLDGLATLGVNLSGQSISDRAFRLWALAELSEAGPEICRRLCLEITETSAVTNLADATTFIAQLRGVGVSFALDDFGAGAASFGYLKTMPVDYLKIDGQFIRDLMTDRLDAAAVRCFADVAKVVGMKTIAEFVDSAAVLTELRRMGIDFVQGFFIHRPAPLEELMLG